MLKLALAGNDRAAQNVVEPGRYADTSADAIAATYKVRCG